MPIDYEIERADEHCALVRTTCRGAVDFEQALEHFRALVTDPRRQGRLDVLLDLRSVETLPDREQVREVAEQVGGMLPVVQWRRLAVVAARDVVFGVSRMFEAHSEPYFEETHVFRDLDEAEAWLDRP